MTGSVIVRSQGVAREYYLTVAGAFRRACIDAQAMGCMIPSFEAFCGPIEEGRRFVLVSDFSVDFQAHPLGD